MNDEPYLFTSESVGEGHPDKLADQISDAVLDACLAGDAESHVACETFMTTGLVLVGGEINTKTYVDIQDIARQVVRKVGYDRPEYGLDWESMSVLNAIHTQSPDIERGVSGHGLYPGQQGAGDQGTMFGFACSETPSLMPATITYAHALLRYAARARKQGDINWLRPDSKSQITIEYRGYQPQRIDNVVVSHQHDPTVGFDELKETIVERIIKPVLEPTGLLDGKTRYFVNPTGRFVIGGPYGDTGLTGRKIIVDSYGGAGRHGGGAFSGKDPSKVDRSAAYMARYVARNIVAADLATRCEVHLSYAIGVPFPLSVTVDTFGTSVVPERQITTAVREVFDLSPAGIIQTLDLKRPIYFDTACYGHFGNDAFPWERTDATVSLRTAAQAE